MPKNVFPAKLFSVDLGDAKRAWKMYPLLICLMDLKSETYNLGCPRKLPVPWKRNFLKIRKFHFPPDETPAGSFHPACTGEFLLIVTLAQHIFPERP